MFFERLLQHVGQGSETLRADVQRHLAGCLVDLMLSQINASFFKGYCENWLILADNTFI